MNELGTEPEKGEGDGVAADREQDQQAISNSETPSYESGYGEQDVGMAVSEKQGSRAADGPPDGGYGWVVVCGSFLVSFSTWGLNSAFSIYLSHYLNNNVFAGGTRLRYACVGGLSFGFGLVFSPLVNYLEGMIGTQYTILLGGVCEFAALMLASFSTKLWQLFLTEGLLQSVGLVMCSLPNQSLTSQWFDKRRQLANSIATAGSGAGGLVFILSMQKVIETNGYKWGLRAQAIIALFLIFVAVCLIRTKNSHHKTEFTLYDSAVVKCTGFWIFIVFIIICLLGYVIVLFSLVNFTTSLGYSAQQGSIVAAMVQLGFVIGRPLSGLVSDFLGPVSVTSGAYYMAALLTLSMWIPARNYATVVAYGLVCGTFIGAIWSTFAGTLARIVGMSKLNVAMGIAWVPFGITATFGEMIGLELTSSNLHSPKAYTNTAIFSGVCFFVAATVLLALRGYLIARDKLENDEFNSEKRNALLIKVPLKDIIKDCLTWPQKRA